MKNIRNKAKTLLIIVLIAFIIIPYLTILLENFLKIEEGLTVNLKTSDENTAGIQLGLKTSETDVSNTQIDRILTTGGQYKYCIGDISCSGGDLVKEGTDAYTLSDGTTKVGYTYQETCGDGSAAATCSGASSFSKFYGPFDGVPAVFEVSGNSLTISDTEFAADANPGGSASSSGTGDSGSGSQTQYDNLKCLADNGAVAGDPLCCGQDGVIQNTKYNCPSEYPHCIGYKCGETWGRCSKTSSE